MEHDEPVDRIVRLVEMYFGMPVILISIVDLDRTWFRYHIGLGVWQAPREISICTHTILQNDVLICYDLRAHPILKANPLITGRPGFWFYAGAPITLDNGFNGGSVRLMDYEARHVFKQRDEDILNDFAGVVVHQPELNQQLAEGALARGLAEYGPGKATSTNAEVLKMPFKA